MDDRTRDDTAGEHAHGHKPAKPELALSYDREAEQERNLRRMKAIPTLLLAVMAAVYVATIRFGGDSGWVGYVQAFAEAAMVGALADWFAVTALFRHPLGLPIPHTAIVPRRKDEIGANLARFVHEHFLTRDVVRNKLRRMDFSARAARWMSRPESAEWLTEAASRLIEWFLNALADRDVQDFLDRTLMERAKKIEAAPVVGHMLEMLTANNRHQELLTEGLRLAVVILHENKNVIRAKVREESPWWMPGFIDDQILKQLVERVETLLFAMALDHGHPMRQQFDARVAKLVEDLKSSQEFVELGETLKHDILGNPAIADYIADLWGDLRRLLLSQAADTNSELRGNLRDGVQRLAREMLGDPRMRRTVNRWVEDGLVYVVESNGYEIAELISDTVETWDPDATARRIELQVGKDLQYIRINGTVVGGLAGLGIHAAAMLM